MEHEAYDVVVVGCGISGLSAAASAVQEGLSVAVLERAPKEDYGGNTRWTEANMRMKNEREVSDDFESMLAENAGYNLDPNLMAALASPYENWPPMVKAHGLPDPEIVSTLSANAGPTLAWLQEFGIKFDKTPPPLLLTVSAPRIRPVGGGLALIETLSAYAHAHGVAFHFETTAYELILDDVGSVCGVMVAMPRGGAARSEGMPWCSHREDSRAIRRCSRNISAGARSSSARSLAAAGTTRARECGWRCASAPPPPATSVPIMPSPWIRARARRIRSSTITPMAFWSIASAKRFIDEAPGPVDNNYDHISRTIAEQPEGLVYVIYDGKIDDVPNWRRSIRSEHPPIEAPTAWRRWRRNSACPRKR